MNTYKRHRFPPDIISYAVWLYCRFNLSHRDIEDTGDTFFIDEVFVKINGKHHYLWRAVDQGGELVDVHIEISGEVYSMNGVGQWLENQGQIIAV